MDERHDAPVVIWTGRGCGACVQAKRLLDGKRVAYKERRLKNEPAIRRSFARATGGARAVPPILVGGDHVGGCDDLVNLERSGELEGLLGRAGTPSPEGLWARISASLTG